MTARALLLAALLPLASFAQDAGTPVPPEIEEVRGIARAFFQALLQADARAAAHRVTAPFHLEGQRLDSEDAVAQELIKHLRAKRTDLLTLYGIEVLTLEEMEAQYGRLPARLSGVPVRQRGAYFAVANLSGRAAVAMLKVTGGEWRVFAYHD